MKTDEGATQQGVPEITDPRDAISAKYEEQELADLSPVGEAVEWERGEEEPPHEEEQQAKETHSEEEQAEATPEAQTQTQPPEQMVRVKVDGVEEEVPLSKVLAQYQKNSAADRRLEEARRAIEEARALRTEIAALKQAKPKEEERKPALPADLADALKATVRAQLDVTDPEEYAELEARKAEILELAWERKQQQQVEAWHRQQAAIEARRGMEAFLGKVAESHPDANRYIQADLDAGTVDYDPEFRSWMDTQPPWMQSALLAPDPSGPIYVLEQYKASRAPKGPNLDARTEAKRKMDIPPAANKRAAPAKDKGDEDDTASYVQQLKQMRAGPRAGLF